MINHAIICPYDECYVRDSGPECYDRYINCPDFLVWHSDLMDSLRESKKPFWDESTKLLEEGL